VVEFEAFILEMTSTNTKKIAATARPQKRDENLDESYIEMASDETAEEEALEWQKP
jgi:hypothetical protein